MHLYTTNVHSYAIIHWFQRCQKIFYQSVGPGQRGAHMGSYFYPPPQDHHHRRRNSGGDSVLPGSIFVCPHTTIRINGGRRGCGGQKFRALTRAERAKGLYLIYTVGNCSVSCPYTLKKNKNHSFWTRTRTHHAQSTSPYYSKLIRKPHCTRAIIFLILMEHHFWQLVLRPRPIPRGVSQPVYGGG